MDRCRQPARRPGYAESLLVQRHEDIERFDAAFDLFFRARHEPRSGLPLFSLGERPRVVVRPVPGVPVHVELEEVGAEEQRESPRATSAYSAVERVADQGLRGLHDRRMEEARRLLIAAAMAPRRAAHQTLGARRRQRHRSSAVAAAEPDARRARRSHVSSAPRNLHDPSSSSATSADRWSDTAVFLLHFVSGLASHARHVEAFVFSTN